ncbi:MAG: hypothetical protein Q8P86_02635 [bacterium]|nr:hypothetical protein [bacterium]
MKTTLKKTLVILFFAISFILPGVAHAQFGSNISENLSVTLNPPRPGPNELTTIRVESYLVNLNTAEIAWFVNGTLQKKARGDKSFAFTTGNLGSRSEITVVITFDDGATYPKTLTIYPADVTLLWETESYTPPFYKGKSYFPHQGVVRAVAIPNIINSSGRRLSVNEVVFTWKKDGRVLGDKSGLGKDTFIAEGGTPSRTVTIAVEVTAEDNQYVAESSFSVSPVRSEVVLYEKSPLYGIFYNNALNSPYQMKDQEVEVAAVPFFFTTTGRDSLQYAWNINGSAILGGQGGSPDITLRNDRSVSGSSFISLRVTNTERMFQFSDNNIVVSFGE